jgi:triosephosphate isomerase
VSARRALVAGNAKMNLLQEEAARLVRAVASGLQSAPPHADVVYCPPFTSLAEAARAAAGTPIALGGQDMHWKPAGAFTGEVSAAMLLDAGCRYVILGHSERRTHFGETDDTVRAKAKAALEAGLVPIVCVGETGAERDAGSTLDVLTRQISGSLRGIRTPHGNALVVAYEPVWAIGTGRNATPAEAQDAQFHLRREIGRLLGEDMGASLRILYGGSVTPENAAVLLSQPDVDGALVGGASLRAESFLAIAAAAPEAGRG